MTGKNGGYAGKISHSGAQKAEAPFHTKKKQTAAVKKGGDLRSGQSSTKKSRN